MKEQKIFCDRCGAEINSFTEYRDLEIELNHISVETDLCENCFENLVCIINNYCNKGGDNK